MKQAPLVHSSQFTGEVPVEPEASGYSLRFVELLEGLGHRGRQLRSQNRGRSTTVST
jgi:hypothetical protein